MPVQPTPGLSDSVHHVYRTDEASHTGEPVDSFESDRVAWVPLTEVRSLIRNGEVVSGTTLAALLYVVG
jgi:ADP-ribose diphosphatase